MTPLRLATAGAASGLLSTLLTLVALPFGDGRVSWPLTVGLLALWPALVLAAAVRGDRFRSSSSDRLHHF